MSPLILDPPDSIDIDLFKQQIPNQSVLDERRDYSDGMKNHWTLRTHDAFKHSDELLAFLEQISGSEFVYEIELEWDRNPRSFTSWFVMMNGIIVKVISESDCFGVSRSFNLYDWSSLSSIATTSIINELCMAPNVFAPLPSNVQEVIAETHDWKLLTPEMRAEVLYRRLA